MKYFITKYALTKGVFEIEGENSISSKLIHEVGIYGSYYCEGEYHTNLVDANAKAEVMRLKKIESLNKQLTKLENMSFIIPEPDKSECTHEWNCVQDTNCWSLYQCNLCHTSKIDDYE